MSDIQQLTIKPKKDGTALSKSAKLFNQLLERVQKAEKNLRTTREVLDQKLNEAHSVIKPVYTELCEVKMAVIRRILEYIDHHKMSKDKLERLEVYCVEMANEIAFGPHHLSEEKEEELRSLLKHLYARTNPEYDMDDVDEASLEEQRAARIEEMKADVKSQFAAHGLEIDLDDITADMSDQEINAAMRKKLSDAKAENEAKQQKTKKKSKAQLKKEAEKQAFEELKDKSFATLYKNLAKLIHPDGEKDEVLRERKTEWMQRLTVAYKEKDLKTLLLIEMEWLNKSHEEVEQLSEEKIRYFNDLLKEQVKELEQQTLILLQHQRYHFLSFFANGVTSLPRFNTHQYAMLLRTSLEDEKMRLQQFEESPKTARKAIKDITTEIDMEDDFYLSVNW